MTAVAPLTTPRLVAGAARRYVAGFAGVAPSAHSLWRGLFAARGTTLPDYRAHNVYVWQDQLDPASLAAACEIALRLVADHLEQVPEEDGALGARTVAMADGRLASRDLLDSLLELGHLVEQLGRTRVATATFLDIGAGYGRLPHRITTAFPRARVLATDGIATSQELCAHYLRFRGATRASVVTPRALAGMADGALDGAVAIAAHSLAEAPLTAIRWWVELCARLGVTELFVVPNDEQGLTSREARGRGHDITPTLGEAGYALVHRRRKYADPAFAAVPSPPFPEEYVLFSRRG